MWSCLSYSCKKRIWFGRNTNGLTISGTEDKNYGMLTNQCVAPATPTPTPTSTPTPSPTPTLTPSDCCSDLENSVTTTGSLDETADVNGVTTFLFEDGGTLCLIL